MNTLALPDSNQLYVVVGGRGASDRLLDMAARLALRGPLLLLDCGNHANPLPLVRELRRLTPDPVQSLRGIQVARAFTCYQVTALLEEAASRPIQHPALVFDLLATFYDESVSYSEGRRLLEQSLRCITYMRQSSPVVVSARPPAEEFPERKSYLERVCGLADVLWIEEPPQAAAPTQLSFFP